MITAGSEKFAFLRPMSLFFTLIMIDFLQALQKEAQMLFVEKCISGLNPGGRLIIRTHNSLWGRLGKDLTANLTALGDIKLTIMEQEKNRAEIIILDKNELN